MNILIQVFSVYDRFISGLPTNAQFFVALILLLAICWSFYGIFAHGHWIFILIFVILFPGTWTAIRTIGLISWQVIMFLLVRIQLGLSSL